MRTATEVGGDYYDFVPGADGSLTVAIGDATGHGAKAGTMVTVIKSLLSAAGGRRPGGGLHDRRQPGDQTHGSFGCMAMALSLVRVEPAASDAAVGADVRVTLAAAGMPPALIYRVASGAVEEGLLPGMPLGGGAGLRGALPGAARPHPAARHRRLSRVSLDPAGEPLGYVGMRQRFASAAKLAESPREVIIALASAAEQWAASRTPADDITFVALQARPA